MLSSALLISAYARIGTAPNSGNGTGSIRVVAVVGETNGMNRELRNHSMRFISNCKLVAYEDDLYSKMIPFTTILFLDISCLAFT